MYQIDDDYKKLADKDADEDKEAMLAGAQVADDQSKFDISQMAHVYTCCYVLLTNLQACFLIS